MRYLDNPNGQTWPQRRGFMPQTMSHIKMNCTRKGEDGLLLLCLGPREAIQNNHRSLWRNLRGSSIRSKDAIGCFTATTVTSGRVYWRIVLSMHVDACSTVPNPWSYTKEPQSNHYIRSLNHGRLEDGSMDVIGKITPSSGSAKHAWILIATYYFTKWVEAKSYTRVNV